MAGDTKIPPLSIVLGFGPMLLLPILAAAAWLAPPWPALLATQAAQAWGAVLLIFLAGVRRGLSFFTEGGPRPIQIVTMFWLFLLGCGALVAAPPLGFSLLVLGYGSIAWLDPRAARRGEAPVFFAKLRPPQMAVALTGLIALLLRVTL